MLGIQREVRTLQPSQSVGIEGIYLFDLQSHPDNRGSFTEIYRHEWMPETQEMVQANLSSSNRNVLRGLHFHRNQADYWCVLQGTALVGLYDLRTGSPTEGKAAEVRLSADEGLKGLYIPKGVAHGFYAETDLSLQYLVDQYFTGADEFGVAWDDPDLGINWPSSSPTLSDRDLSNPRLKEVIDQAPRY